MNSVLPSWRQHFGSDAADVIAIACHWGGFDIKDVLMRCFKRARRSTRISMPTVEAVLQEIRDESKEDKNEESPRLFI